MSEQNNHLPGEGGAATEVDKTGERAHGAGALDIRNIIGALLSIYGVILMGVGFFGDSDTPVPPPAGISEINANLWAGLALLVLGVAFILWAKVNPVKVPTATSD